MNVDSWWSRDCGSPSSRYQRRRHPTAKEKVPEIMQSRGRDAVRNGQGERGDEVVECLAGGAGMDAPPAVEGEQRRAGPGRGVAVASPSGLRRHEGADPRPVRDQAVLA